MNTQRLVSLFPVWLLIACGVSFCRPEIFTWLGKDLIPLALGIVMLGMGLTLKLEDFRRVSEYPKPVLTGVILQYTVMPLAGTFIAYVSGLNNEFAAGLILVSCCPGGTASNVLTYIAKGNVALSVTMTVISTLMAVIATPYLTLLLAGNRVEVNALGLVLSTFQVIIVPVILGAFLSSFFGDRLKAVNRISPAVSVIAIIMIVASIVGSSKEIIRQHGLYLSFCVFCMHSIGFFLGYIISFFISERDRITARTISIEVGMQNSGLGAILAKNSFPSPLTAVPSAISSLFHSLIASCLAWYWNYTDSKRKLETE
ncbi:MAG TPA: bile acid:sodium symporter family protein [Leptospiraceae bacterium]|nr:bile acid:sodium symporter family protein [Leptospiraceae bacterium]HNF23383.1 bile acid:sodium symporter family protein [Leptospiraceae bacterium]HNI27291.1 bile acid:sodium symporter family protein [Leptospiraceae bacterium]HNM03645.1 bile acid:sodium symporter family protein [Leptospiraceae bacterium]HNN03770.1 bile acid:sodium symporter family protein [Leptospiraceae bacterium]